MKCQFASKIHTVGGEVLKTQETTAEEKQHMPETSNEMMEDRLGSGNPENRQLALGAEEAGFTWPWATVPKSGQQN